MVYESPAAGRPVVCRKHSPWTMERDRKKSKAHLSSPEPLSEEVEEEEELEEENLDDHGAKTTASGTSSNSLSLLRFQSMRELRMTRLTVACICPHASLFLQYPLLPTYPVHANTLGVACWACANTLHGKFCVHLIIADCRDD